MDNILVISDNELLNLLYVMNLEVYLNSKVTLADNISNAKEILKSQDFSIVVTLEKINKEEGIVLQQFLKSNGKKTPLIITGTQKDEVLDNEVFKVAGKFNMQSILKTCAKELGITSKQMSELNIGAFYPISTKTLLGLNKAPCHIYQNSTAAKFLVRLNDPMESIIADLEKAGVQQVFVSSGDRLIVTNKISLTLIEKITATLKNLDSAPIEEKLQALSDGHEFAAANLFSSDEIKQQMQEIATASAKVMGDVSKDSSSLKTLLATMMSNKDGYIFTHSMITSYVTYHMVKNATWGGEGQVEKINFVLFFHDIFLAPLYLKYPDLRSETSLLESNLLNDKEKETVLSHARLAAEVVVGYKRCPMGADLLIKQHHGMKKGKGFAKLYMEDLSPLSKIILVAELFVEEFLKTTEEKTPFSPTIIIPKLISEFKSSSYTKLVKSLANIPL